jgi:hypothetical protein
MKKPELDPRPPRADLTDRECTKVLCGCIGSLLQMATPETLERAVQWIAQTPEFWQTMRAQKKELLAIEAEASLNLFLRGEEN